MTEWMDIQQLGNYLNVSVKTLYRMTAKGNIPFYKLGRLIRFKKDEVEEWMTRKRRGVKEAGERLGGEERKDGNSNVETVAERLATEIIFSKKNRRRKNGLEKGGGKE